MRIRVHTNTKTGAQKYTKTLRQTRTQIHTNTVTYAHKSTYKQTINEARTHKRTYAHQDLPYKHVDTDHQVHKSIHKQ